MRSDRKINIMHVALSLQVGGLEKVVAESAVGVDKDIFNVEVCCFDDLGFFAERLVRDGIDVTLVRRNQDHYDPLFPIRLGKLLRDKNTHILHMHSGTFFLGTQAGLLSGVPIMIYTDHGRHLVEPRMLLAMDRFSGFFAKKIIAVSKELERYLTEVVRLPPVKTTTIINGIDTKVFSFREKSLSLLEELNIPATRKIIGTVGRLVEVKDHVTLIRAFHKVVADEPDVTLLFIGDGPMKAGLQQLVGELDLSGKVVFAGSRSDVPELLNLLDVFVLTSLSEGTSISLLEAMASGVVPLVTDVGGNPSIVNHEHNGLLVKPKDVSRIAESLTHLLHHEDVSAEYRRNAVDTVKTHFSLDRMIESYTGVYLDLYEKKYPAWK